MARAFSATRWAEATTALRHVPSPLGAKAAKLEGHLRGAPGAAGHLQEMSLRDATLFCKRLSTEELTSYASSLARLASASASSPPLSAAKAVASATLPQVETFDPADLAKVASALCRLDHFDGAWQLYARVQRCAPGVAGLQDLRGAMLWMSELHPGHLPRAITVLSHLSIFPRVARSPTWRVTLSVAAVLLLWRQLGVSAALASRTALQASGERSHRQVAGALEQRLDDLLLGQEARAASMQQGARHPRQLLQKSRPKELSKEVHDALQLLCHHLRNGAPDKVADRRKEFELLRHLAANAFPWKAEAVLQEMEAFGSRKTFLKLAGGAKRRILERAIHEAPEGLVVELGSYVGFSSSVLALARNGPQLPPSPDQRVGREAPSAPVVVSCELDPCNALLARSVHCMAGLAESIEVWIGNSSDMAHYVHRRFGQRSVAMLFMDHRGSLFHEDLQSFQDFGLLKDGAIVVADNVLKPGAPYFLWQICHSPCFEARLLVVPEFGLGHQALQDWMALGRYKVTTEPEPEGAALPFPGEVHALADDCDQLRRRSLTGKLTSEDWAAHAARMEQKLAELGISATLPDDGETATLFEKKK